jgi:hypothetical protein
MKSLKQFNEGHKQRTNLLSKTVNQILLQYRSRSLFGSVVGRQEYNNITEEDVKDIMKNKSKLTLQLRQRTFPFADDTVYINQE